MSELDATEKAANPYAKQFLIIGVTASTLALMVYYIPALQVLRLPLAYILPFALAYGIFLAVHLYRTGPDPLPSVPFIIGFIFAVGGAMFDGIATLIKTPSLACEGNPIAKALLASGYSTPMVIAYGIIAQILFVSLICILWGAFLRHKVSMVLAAYLPFVPHSQTTKTSPREASRNII